MVGMRWHGSRACPARMMLTFAPPLSLRRHCWRLQGLRDRLSAAVGAGLVAGPPSRTELVYSEVRLQTDGLGGHVYRASPLLGIASMLGLGVSQLNLAQAQEDGGG